MATQSMHTGQFAGIGGSRRHPIHPSLIRPILFAGVDQSVAILEGTLVVALIVGVGLHLVTAGLAIVVLVVVHPIMVRLTARDPHITRVYLRSTSYTDYYASVTAVRTAHGPVRSSVPSIR